MLKRDPARAHAMRSNTRFRGAGKAIVAVKKEADLERAGHLHVGVPRAIDFAPHPHRDAQFLAQFPREAPRT